MNTAIRRIRVGLLYNLKRPILARFGQQALLLALGIFVWCMPAHAQENAAGATRTFPLRFVEKSASMSMTMDPGKREVKFLREPEFGEDKVFRRALSIGPGKDDFLAFAVDLTKKTLHVDLNQNLDLTDDPQGVFKGKESSASYVIFDYLKIAFTKNGLDRALVFQPFEYSYSDNYYLVLRSSFQAEIELSGKKWQLEVMDNGNGTIDDADRFTLSPAAESGNSRGSRPAYSAMKIPKTLFLGGRLYELNFTFAARRGDAPLAAGFSEVAAPMAELSFDGRFIARLVLEGKALAVLDWPGQTVTIPSDTYNAQSIYLQSAPGDPLLVCNKVEGAKQLAVAAGTPGRLKTGGPLVSTVETASRGSMLTLSYVLKGVGGELYNAVKPDTKNPPRLTISQGGKQLYTGKFEFG